MHKDYCQCPRCVGARRTKKLGLGIGIPVAAVIAAFFVFPNFTNLTDTVVSKATDFVSNDAPPVTDQPVDKPATNEPEVVMPEPEQEEHLIEIPKIIFEKPTLQELREYALKKINEDRAQFKLSPVELSDNKAAQVHAEDVLTTREISHWMTNGEKPYMTYTRLGGVGHVGQNVGLSGSADYYQDCTSGFHLCDRTDPFEDIDQHQYGMMYDDAESNWGHRDNILEPQHTHVSIGIAYDDYTFVLVQNFEDNYINFIAPVTTNDEDIQLTGRINSNYHFDNFIVFYDELPTPAIYEANYMQTSYDVGTMIAGVAPLGSHFTDIETIRASTWYEKNDFIDIRFSLENIANKEGVYTIVAWLENEDGEQFPVTNYSVFVD